MDNYLFLLGQNQALSLAELHSLFPQGEFAPANSAFTKISFPQDTNPLSLACRLGGTTKIAQAVAPLQTTLAQQIADLVVQSTRKNFSITFISNQPPSTRTLAQEVKDILSKKDHSSRFISASSQSLSPLIVAKQHVAEFIVNEIDGLLYQTVWTHPFSEWIARDRQKPFIDPHSGMLPPKLARIMVNLAIGDRNPQDLNLLDPFCGTGTILMEAKLIGANVIGADLSAEKVAGAAKNLNWLPESHFCAPAGTSTTLQADAVKLSHHLHQSVDVIVTEPFLGPPKFHPGQVANITKGLTKLYIGALKEWRRFLKPGARLVIAFPQYILGSRVISTSDFIDRRENLGYNLLVKDLVFTRPKARIIRQIVILEAK